jgi:hypothetical protein
MTRKAVSMAQEDISMAKEGCPYGTRGQCIWHRTVAMTRKAVSMAQEDIPMAKKNWMSP